MRCIALVIALSQFAVGCANVHGVALAAHGSDPSRGQPVNDDCDPTFDFGGGGIAIVSADERNRFYVVGGQKLVRQCRITNLPHLNDRGLGGMAIYIHEFRRGK